MGRTARWTVLAVTAALVVACGAPAEETVTEPSPHEADDLTEDVDEAEEGDVDEVAQGDVDEVTQFYQGKTVTIIVGYNPGGAFDLYSRMLAEYLPRHIPGNPNVIVENRPGAASAVAASAVYATEPQDGTVIGAVGDTLVLTQALGVEGIDFDLANVHWLGAARKGSELCAVRGDLEVDTLEDLIVDGAPEIVIGTLGPGSGTHSTPALFAAVLGANIRLVPGYDGVDELQQAFESGEVDGLCRDVTWLDRQGAHLFTSDPPAAKVIGILGSEVPDHPLLPEGVPAAEDLASTEEDRLALQVADGPNDFVTPWLVGPDAPADRVAALRQAVEDTFADPEFIAVAEDSGLGFDPSTGAEVAERANAILNAPAEVLDRLKDVFDQ